MILTTYLTSLPDPQRRSGLAIVPDRQELMPLLDGVREHEHPTVVFHDQLTSGFVKQHEGKHVWFEKVVPDSCQSLNDWRFFLFRDFLGNVPANGKGIWISDLFDVRLNNNPDMLVNWDEDYLFLGRQPWSFNRRSMRGKRHCRMMCRWYSEVPEACRGEPILMAGTWGGRRNAVVKFLGLLCEEITSLQPGRKNCNMAAFNQVAYTRVGKERFWSEGEPLHSVLGAKDVGNTRVAFVHK